MRYCAVCVGANGLSPPVAASLAGFDACLGSACCVFVIANADGAYDRRNAHHRDVQQCFISDSGVDEHGEANTADGECRARKPALPKTVSCHATAKCPKAPVTCS